MKDSLSDVWSSWVEQHHGVIPKDRFCVPFRILERSLLPSLKKQGLQVSSRRTTRSALENGLGELEIPSGSAVGGADVLNVTYYHFLNLVWEPIIVYIESLLSDPNSSTNIPEINKALIEQEMHGIVLDSGDILTMAEWAGFIQETLSRLVQVDVPLRLIMTLVSPIPLCLSPQPGRMPCICSGPPCARTSWARLLHFK